MKSNTLRSCRACWRGGAEGSRSLIPIRTQVNCISWVRKGRGSEELVDRLMISALIEARSCERFQLLGGAVDQNADPELKKLYRDLWASEHGHYRTFIQLAEEILASDHVAKRWHQMLDSEARIIQHQPPGARMHSG